MISTVLRIHWLNLRRDRIAWLLSFVVPVAVFSVFAVIFGGMGKGETPAVSVIVVDEDGSDFSRRLVAALGRERGLALRPAAGKSGQDAPATRDSAEALVRNGDVSVAIILPPGLGKAFTNFDREAAPVELLADTSDKVAPQMASGLLQKALMTGAPDVYVTSGIAQFEKYAGALTDEQRRAVDQWLPRVRERVGQPNAGGADGDVEFGVVPIKIVDLLGQTKANPVVAFYAAGTAVMFLLFACSSGGGGSLLEEVESGTLDRLLSSRLGMTQLLVGKWLWFALVGVVQVTVMFLWGAVAFKVELFQHLAGFAAMTAATAAAASGFGLLLASLCQSRAQLQGISTTVILIMSAVGGSMFPRFLMSDTMKTVGLFTFNAWALDGYQKVFWRDAAVWELWPQLLVLTGLAIVFMAFARLLARRWETA